MNEYRAMAGILRRKDNSIPRAVQYWLYFKAHVLEDDDVREAFKKPLDRRSFKRLLMEEVNPLRLGPRFCRLPHAESRRRNLNELVSIAFRYYLALLHPSSPLDVRRSEMVEGELGLFLKADLAARGEAVVPWPQLFGLAMEVGADEFDELREAGHQSLLEGRRQYVIIGPLALVNHRCSAPLCFSKVGVGATAEEFEGIPSIRVFAREGTRVAAGSELLVDYFHKPCHKRPAKVFGHDCRCPSCR